MRDKQSWRSLALVGILGIAVAGSTLAIARKSDYAFFDPLIDIRAVILQRYVDPVDEPALQRGAISGLLESLGDEYTLFVPPASEDEFRKEMLGEFVGIGALIAVREGALIVVTPLDDSPAYRGGILADDRIVQIDGTPTMGLSSARAAELLSGRPGTKVTLTLDRAGESLTREIVRERITTRTVKGFERDAAHDGQWRYMIDPDRGIAYLRLTQFTPTSSAEVVAALDALGARRGDLNGLILDLRWNPGGVLQEAQAIADLFLEEGVILSTRGRAVPEQFIRARREGTLPDFPVVLLVDGHSASASEVLAGALTENGRAIALGERTFGKGVVQGVHTLPRGRGHLKITEQRYYLPSGRSLHREDDSDVWGVDPSPGFFVSLTEAQQAELRRARQLADVIRAEGEASPPPAAWNDPDWIEGTLHDPQLAGAIRAMRARLESGAWTPLFPEATETAPLSERGERSALRLQRERLAREAQRIERRLDALERGGPPENEAFDLWGDDVKVSGGQVVVFDADGNEVATLEIVGENLERWLMDAGVRKIDPP